MTKTAISPTRAENYPEWYQQVIKAADLAENSVVRGCMVIKPWGYAIWENIQKNLDRMIKETGHKNFYCPLFVPLSFLEKEAAHVEGFAKECAVVTHHRLETNSEGKLQPAGELEEPLIIRPTSEAIIGDLYSRWIQSYRDLPLLYNQWCNVVRWEMRTRIFLRTSEFLWQEGHTAHATEAEAREETLKMLNTYVTLVQDYMAMPVAYGEKTKSERFPGAVNTYTIEAMMQDKKALQNGTSHYLGQNFAKAFNIKFLSAEGTQEYVHTTSWGATTRLIGSMIMMHSDDDGLVLPPRIAPLHVIIMPLIRNEQDKSKIMEYCTALLKQLQTIHYDNAPIQVEIDAADIRPGEKAWGWVKKGVPLRLEIGMQEVDKNAVFMGRRDKAYNEKVGVDKAEFLATVAEILTTMQNNIFARAKKFQQDNTVEIKSPEEFYKFFDPSNESSGGFALAPWIDEPVSEEKMKQELKVTARVIPQEMVGKTGTCIFTGKPDAPYTVFAKSY
jgi:prolyl-tRNA synthetase